MVFNATFNNISIMSWRLSKCTINYFEYLFVPLTFGGRRDRMVVRFTITYAISANNHYRCEFESHSGEVHSIQHYVIKFVSELRRLVVFSLT
jgi:hypothetical protein